MGKAFGNTILTTKVGSVTDYVCGREGGGAIALPASLPPTAHSYVLVTSTGGILLICSTQI